MEDEDKNKNSSKLVMRKREKAESSVEHSVRRRLRHKIKPKQGPLD